MLKQVVHIVTTMRQAVQTRWIAGYNMIECVLLKVLNSDFEKSAADFSAF
jgi:hypothetical protein